MFLRNSTNKEFEKKVIVMEERRQKRNQVTRGKFLKPLQDRSMLSFYTLLEDIKRLLVLGTAETYSELGLTS